MNDATVEARLAEMTVALARLDERVARLEAAQAQAPARAQASAGAPEPEVEVAVPASAARLLDVTLFGRSLIVLGVGYLLRALTDLQAVPDAVGGAAGLALAVGLLVLADRAAAHGKGASSLFHAATALTIADPLIGELVGRFHLLGPEAAAALLVAIGGAALVVARRRGAVGIAWLAVVATALAIGALLVQTFALIPCLAAALALVAAAAIVGRALAQRYLVWPAAVLADVLVVVLMPRVLWGRSDVGPASAAAAGVVFFAVVAVGTFARAVRERAPTSVPEIVESGIAYVIGFLPAAALAARSGFGPLFGAAAIVLAVVGTLLARRALLDESKPRRGLVAWTTLGLAVALAGIAVLAPGAWLAIGALAPAILLFALAASGRPEDRPLAELQALAALVVAAAASGLVGVALRGLTGAPADADAAPGVVAWIVLGAIVAAPVRGGASRAGQLASALAIAGATFAVAGVVAALIVGATGVGPEAAATLRSTVVALAAVGLALASRRPRLAVARALVYPALALLASKIFLEDLRVGATTRFVSLALLGVALIVAPRLRGRAPSATA